MMTREKSLFDQYCRVKGTRCDRIMTMIEAGAPNEYIATKFKTGPRTIQVYRNAYNNKLAPINHRVMPITES